MGEAVDIYATKGVEYLIVLGYLMVLVGLWVLPAVVDLIQEWAAAASLPPQPTVHMRNRMWICTL